MRIGLSNKITQSLSSSGPVDNRPQIALDLTDTYGRKHDNGHYFNIQFPYSFVNLNSTTGVAINDPFADYRDSGSPIQVFGVWYLPPIISPLKITLTLNSGSFIGSNTDIFNTYPAALAIYLSLSGGARETAFSEVSLAGTTLDIINHTWIQGHGGAGGRGGVPGPDGKNNTNPGGGGGGGAGYLGGAGGIATSTANPGAAGFLYGAGAGGAGGLATGQSTLSAVDGRTGGSAIALYQGVYPARDPKVSITNETIGAIISGGGGGGGGGGSGGGSVSPDDHGGSGGIGGAVGMTGAVGGSAGQTSGSGGAAGKAIDESGNVNVTPINKNPGNFRGSEADY
jgi:hypothetical protein